VDDHVVNDREASNGPEGYQEAESNPSLRGEQVIAPELLFQWLRKSQPSIASREDASGS
jgi:hypothetical protein